MGFLLWLSVSVTVTTRRPEEKFLRSRAAPGLLPVGSPISSRRSCGSRWCSVSREAHDGALLRCGHPIPAALDPLPFRHHVDRSPVLLQLRARPVLRRGGRLDQERRDTEARAAGAVVVPLGGGADVPVGSRDPGPTARQLERPLGDDDPERRGVRHSDAVQRVARDLAQPAGGDRERGGGRGGQSGEPPGGGRGAACLPGVPHQRRPLVSDALLHGRGVALSAECAGQPDAVGNRAARDPGAARDQRPCGEHGADQETDRNGARRDRDRIRDGGAGVLDRPSDAWGVTATAAAPRVGDLAPDFTLPGTAGADVALANFRGRKNVLLAFFPLAFTSTCTAELCAFSEDFDRFAGAGTAVLPISVDSVPTLKEFKAKYAMQVDLLSDFKRIAARAYGVLIEDKFFTQRAYVLIDRTGRIRWQHTEAELGHRRDDAELLRQIATLEA